MLIFKLGRWLYSDPTDDEQAAGLPSTNETRVEANGVDDWRTIEFSVY